MKQDSEDRLPYTIPFSNIGLQLITGGVPGGRMTELSGDSQCGKSYLFYDLMLSIQSMGGYTLMSDPEIGWEPKFGRRVGLTDSFLYSDEKIMEKVLSWSRDNILAIRKKDKKAPILFGIDSYAALGINMSAKEIAKHDGSKELKGYMSAKKNAVFAELIRDYINFYSKYSVAFVLINQTRVKMGMMFGDPTTVNAENVIKFYATLRLQGKLGSKIKVSTKLKKNNEYVKKQVGVIANWETIKNRLVEPFKKVSMEITYKKGIKRNSGLGDLLLMEDRVDHDQGKGTFKYKGKSVKKEKIHKLVKKFPELLEPLA